MTGSPFSNVVGHDADSSTFQDVESPQKTDTTSLNAVAPVDSGTEPSEPVAVQPDGSTTSAGEDETAGDAATGRAPGQ